MKVKISELKGAALDWAVAKAEGYHLQCIDIPTFRNAHWLQYSQHWNLAGPIIEREGINLIRCNDLYFPKGNEEGQHWEPLYKAFNRTLTRYGSTPLITAMRCYVASKLGDEVEIPDELV